MFEVAGQKISKNCIYSVQSFRLDYDSRQDGKGRKDKTIFDHEILVLLKANNYEWGRTDHQEGAIVDSGETGLNLEQLKDLNILLLPANRIPIPP